MSVEVTGITKRLQKYIKNNKIDIIQSVNSYGLAFLRKKIYHI